METAANFEVVFRTEYSGLVRALSVAFNPELAADAVQEAFIEADARWAQVSAYDRPAAWIRRVALNKATSGKRTQRRRSQILAGITPVRPDDLTAELLDLRQALLALPERQRLTICLHYLAGLPVNDVADVLEVSAGTVKSNLHDARKQLRELLEENHG